ncbi:hypothetical protein CLV51_103115 [Chitinophaga niastensis]|uniref:Uncharacterized protein n=1 Tax=Chitinophaga niastensis TaxID=536980 RepID=A0A2P8HIT9_CHINA|nr:hypothetical protein [Chitinophaga niastensis]PSL46139.1 hypothetical protein CLV51_103115 [Chitinophaga niastensis]
MENFDHILIFRTNIRSTSDKKRLQPILDANECIEHWNIDLDDVDYVLRIISYQLKHQQIIELIEHHGYECCELGDDIAHIPPSPNLPPIQKPLS